MKKITAYIVLSIIVFASCQKENQGAAELQDSDCLSFSVSSSFQENIELKSSLQVPSSSFEAGNLVLSVTELSASDLYGDNLMTKGTPLETESSFKDNIQYMKVWGINNGSWLTNYVSQISTPQLLKNKDMYYYPVDSEDKYMTVSISSLEWKNPIFYSIAPAEPEGATYSTANTSGLVYNYKLPTPDPTENNDAVNQKDWLMGYFSGTSADFAKNTVPLKFTHPMAAIRFKSGHVGRNVTINNISLVNVVSQGTCTYYAGRDSVVWTNNTGNYQTYVQEFNQQIPPEGQYLGDDEQTKTFFAIPQTFVGNTAAEIKVEFTDEGNDYTAYFTLNGRQWRANKIYEYTLSTMDGVWIDFNGTKVYGGNGFTDIVVSFNTSMSYKLDQKGGSHEKVNIPVHNLVPGTWYELEFSEIFEKPYAPWDESVGEHWNAKYGSGAFATGFYEEIQTGTDCPSIITLWDGGDELSQYKYFWPVAEGVNAYTPSSHRKICFYATASDMYWIWDTSKCKDSSEKGNDFFVEFHSINKINAPTVPAVDYLNATLYGFRHIKTGNNDDTGFSAFKSYARFGTQETDAGGDGVGELEIHGKLTDNWEKVNIPLINLEVNKQYTIYFSYNIGYGQDGGSSTTTCFGYSVDSTRDTDVTTMNPNAIDKSSQMTNGTEYAESVTFTATAETMYLNWDFSRFKSVDRPVAMFFTKTKIVEVE